MTESTSPAAEQPAERPPRGTALLRVALSRYVWDVEFGDDGVDIRTPDKVGGRDKLTRWLRPPPLPAQLSQLSLTLGRTHFELEPGLTLLLAPTGWGKSTFLRALRPSAAAYALVGELLTVSALEDGDYHATLESAVSSMLAEAWRNREGEGTLLLLDSLRELVYGRSQGGTGEGGVDLYASIQLTALSNALILLNAHMLAAFNPLIDRSGDRGDARWNQLREVLTGSVAVWEGGDARGSLLIHNRGPVSDQREAVTRTFGDLPAEPVLSTPADPDDAPPLQLSATTVDVPFALRRSLLRGQSF